MVLWLEIPSDNQHPAARDKDSKISLTLDGAKEMLKPLWKLTSGLTKRIKIDNAEMTKSL